MSAEAPKTASEASSHRAWDALTPPLAEWILDAVSSMGFRRMTPVQASTIPLFMAHKDVVVEAVTGSGKTLTFLIPVVERLLRLEEAVKKHHVGAIIISPTRELASQIHRVLQSLLAFHGPSTAVLNSSQVDEGLPNEDIGLLQQSQHPPFSSKVVSQLLLGGITTPAQDLKHFLENSPNLLIATPGRLLELLSSPQVHCPQSSFEILVLDEADRLLDLGFKEDLQKILRMLPKQRRTGLFSASVSEAVDQIVRVGLRNPVKISVKVKGTGGRQDQRTPASLQMSYLIMPASHKFPAVTKLLSSLDLIPNKTILYLSTCAAVDYFQHVLSSIFNRSGGQFDLVPLHGKHPSSVRQKNFARFTNSISPSILLTTDVAARGLDIPQVDLVVQIDPPSDPKVFLHRCGRAGRAGRRGLSVILLQPGREEDYIPFLEVRKTPVSQLSEPSVSVTEAEAASVSDEIRNIVRSDRTLHDKAQRGFVSSIKAYSKHQTSSIFRVGDLDWEDLGKAWGLLKLPKMPELKRWEGDKSLGLEVDFETYAYKDKPKEESRKKALNERNSDSNTLSATGQSHAKATKRAWSQKLDQRDDRVVRREKKKARRERDKWEEMGPAEREKQRELERMIEVIRKENLRKPHSDDEFEGFDG